MQIPLVRADGSEQVLAVSEAKTFEPEEPEKLINAALDRLSPFVPNEGTLHVNVRLNSPEELRLRPSLHLSAAILRRLSTVRAELDFDPDT